MKPGETKEDNELNWFDAIFLACVMRILGLCILACIYLAGVEFLPTWPTSRAGFSLFATLFSAFAVVSAGAATRCFLWARRFVLVARSRQLPRDDRAPVLYLRSFVADSASFDSVSYQSAGLRMVTEEEEIASVLRRVGPLVAIGRPGELPHLGARRIYQSDGEWQEAVSRLMVEARLVILRTDFSQGLRWEFQEAVRRVPPKRLVIINTYDRLVYEAFCECVEGIFPRGLPQYCHRESTEGRAVSVICFGFNWEPCMAKALERPKRGYLRSLLEIFQSKTQMEQELSAALEPVFEWLEVHQRPQDRPRRGALRTRQNDGAPPFTKHQTPRR